MVSAREEYSKQKVSLTNAVLYGHMAERWEAHKEFEEDLPGAFHVHPLPRTSVTFIGQRLVAIKPFDFFFYEHPIPPTFDILKKAIAGATGVKTAELFLAADNGTKLPYDTVMLHKYKQMAPNLQDIVPMQIHVLPVHDSNEPKRRKLSVVTNFS